MTIMFITATPKAASALLAMTLVAGIALPQAGMAAPAAGIRGTDIAIAAFKDVCLRSAPSFASALTKAKRYGVKETTKLGDSNIGMTSDDSISVQVKLKRECAVTSPNRSNPTLHAQFLRTIAEFADAPPQGNKAGVPFTGTIQGHRFVFMHDRKGGEAYVMISLEK
ncbi:hypothetical protein PMI09_02389 [Rhizobium sp. CF122]|uniref:hypothetical protein n=1 Tax=Rhizobium sp. CF122 TaxID=1144312 RepID=UPI0002716CBE|nr:hypothetical protein [Rhizobium sp. CF122]EJL54646.1 hypothetical protein PMI09_02389 [Rhizobium sp. CF122]